MFESLTKRFEKKEKPKIKEVGKFGEDGWSIFIGDVDKDE